MERIMPMTLKGMEQYKNNKKGKLYDRDNGC